MILVLVRHGVPAGADGTCYGHHDLPLAAHGGEALARLGRAWAEAARAGRAAIPAPTRVVASDLLRARDSAALVAEPFALSVATDRRLREMHFGAWEGRPWAELEAVDGARLQAWMADWATVAAPEGEGFGDLAARVRGWLDETTAAGARDDVVLAVAHAGSIRALLCAVMEWPLAHAFRVRVDHARVHAVRLGARGAELLVANADRVPERGG